MRKIMRDLILLLACLGMLSFLIPSYSVALEKIDLCDWGDITFYGWLRNNTGLFLHSQDYAENGNQLATERTTFRGYMDWNISNQVRFWSAVELAYEPWYPVEKDSITSTIPYRDSFFTGYTPTRHNGGEYSEYNNANDILRECYLELKPNDTLDIKIGRQIAIWGEALTTRVGDVVHPDNQRFTFAFANLEDTRIPSVMMRGIYTLTALNSSFEWIYSPPVLQNMWNVDMDPNFAVAATNTPGQRFAIYAPNITTPYIPSFENVKYPTGWGDNSRGGFRTNTVLSGYSFGLSFFHTQEYSPLPQVGKIMGYLNPFDDVFIPIRKVTLVYPDKDIIGAYMNKQLTGSSPIPGVIRTEAIYVPNQPFSSLSNPYTIIRRDYIKYLIGYDLNNFFYPSWHNTAPINLTIEHVGQVVPHNNDVGYTPIYQTEQKKWNPNITGRLSTNWRYNQIETDIIASYFPWGESGLIMPYVQYTLPWYNQAMSAEIRYIDIFGRNNYQGLGILRYKDMVVLTLQFNW